MSEPPFFIGWEGRTGLVLLLAANGGDPLPAGFGGPVRDGLAEGPQRLGGVQMPLP
jgi:hypothetical protein